MKKSNIKKIIRDWKIIISIFGVGLISLTVFAWWIYLSNKIAGGYLAPQVEQSNPTIKKLDEKRLEAGLTILETRQADFAKLPTNRLKPIDPSL